MMDTFIEFSASAYGLIIAGLITSYIFAQMVGRAKEKPEDRGGVVYSVSPVGAIVQIIMLVLLAVIVILNIVYDNSAGVKILNVLFAVIGLLGLYGGEALIRYGLKKISEIMNRKGS